MKILEVVSYLYPALSYGGPAKVVYDLANELSKKNQVTVYTTDVWDEKRRIKRSEKIKSSSSLKVTYFRNGINSLAYRQRFFTGFGMVTRFVKDCKSFDIVHIHDIFILPQLVISYLALLFKIPYVVSPHGVLDPIRVEQKSVFKRIIYRLFALKMLNRANCIIATSDQEEKILRSLGFKNVVTVFNGVDTKKSRPSNKFKIFKNTKFTLLYIGKIHSLKGLSGLVRSLKDMDLNTQLLIAGPDDGYKNYLIREIEKTNVKNVHFLGLVDERQKSELFALADIFVHPSLSEGFSISILEALKYGVPVLITNACNFPEVKEYSAGYVISENKLVKECRLSIKNAFNNPKKLKIMSKNAKILLQSRYSIKQMADKIYKLYEIYT